MALALPLSVAVAVVICGTAKGRGSKLGFSYELDDEELPTQKTKGATQWELPMLADIRKIEQ
jgi:hypothetical protein